MSEFEFRIEDFWDRIRILSLAFRLLGFGFWIWGFGFWVLDFPAAASRWNGGKRTPPKCKTCRFCNARSFSGGHCQGPLDFLDVRLLGTA